MKALVLAAGKSTRISETVGGLPKPLVNLGGMPIVEHTLRWLASHGISDVWINLHYRPDAIRSAIGDGLDFDVNIQYSLEPEILGTAGAVKKLEAEWDDDFVVAYGDNYVGFDLTKMIGRHQDSGAAATLALFDWHSDRHSGIAGGRVMVDADMRIRAFGERCTADQQLESQWVNAGVYVLDPSVCGAIPADKLSDFGRDVFPRLIKDGGAVLGFPIASYCLAVDTPEAYARAKRMVEEMAGK